MRAWSGCGGIMACTAREPARMIQEDQQVTVAIWSTEEATDSLGPAGVFGCTPLGQNTLDTISPPAPTPRATRSPALGEDIRHLDDSLLALSGGALLEAPSSSELRKCGCGCDQPAPIAKRTDHRSGAIAGRPQKFIRGHAARLQRRHLEFSDITAAAFWRQTETIKTKCVLFPQIQVSVGGRRVYAAQIALLLQRDQIVSAEGLARLKFRGRCRLHRRCVNPAHQVLKASSYRAQSLKVASARHEAIMRAMQRFPGLSHGEAKPSKTCSRGR